MGSSVDDAAAAEASVADMATVHIRCSNGSKFSVQADLGSTVSAFKALLVEQSDVPADQQRLIYKGRVLKDENTLESYGLQSDHTVHLVRGAPAASMPSSTTPAVSVTTAAPEPTSGVSAVNGIGLGGAAGLGGVPSPLFGSNGAAFGGLPEFQQVQQQLMQNPNIIREMMNSPAVQSLINNPDLMRSLIMSNPQMREIIDRNPDLAHIINDPGTLRQTLDAARNPELMREMMRNTDRAMSNIEASPEGFNMLRRMYETVQEPLLNAATLGTEGGGGSATNPFAALLGAQRSQAQGPAAPGTTVTGATAVPNTAPLPNPWNPTPRTAGDLPEQTAPGSTPGTGAIPPPQGLGGLASLAGLGLPDFNGGMDGGLGLVDPGSMQQMLQNPAILQMMQGLLSNPQYINQVLNMQPHLRSMIDANPQFREMMQNPEFLRQISSPESLQQMFTLQQSLMMGQLGRQQPGQTGAPATPGSNLDLSSLLSMLGGLGGTLPVNTPQVNAVPPEQLYASQLSQLQDMGFFDIQENIRALTATGGNIHAAVERLLGNPG
ncbi:hypothetical protein O6H91_19G036300 [Diphasiastrum complanatum]|uniref:Uncharacterized protein n=3 Tax=Diphasiastrum complanatum TaxID=34168 RepID=A0ACC2AU55_DIPCM|nr:hypothetical protein O6H91_19G035300 [Diphasiastrum complanatum]KAJ7521061.1 hypothetical protein O6H91_19G036300 [Diphasiastrum complanatum]